MMKRLTPLILVGLLGLLFVILVVPQEVAAQETWKCTQRGTILEIAYGSGTSWPQYAALHLDSSYFRLVHDTDAGWGTSIILLPAFWSGGIYYQGAPVAYTCHTDGSDLVMSITGTIDGLSVSLEVRISPPADDSIVAQVTTQVNGSVSIDPRLGEAFKPVMLSSMHISSTIWDAAYAYAGCCTYPIPPSGWIIQPPAVAPVFGLVGGASEWKTKAPTIEVVLDRPMQITGWVTLSSDPNDDNVGFWAASDDLLSSWSYQVTAKPSPTQCLALSKTASPSPVGDGEALTYTIHVTNTGYVTLTATIKDMLPGPVIPNGVVTWPPVTLYPGDVWTDQLNVTVQPGYTGLLTNKVEITTQQCAGGRIQCPVCANVCRIYVPLLTGD